MASRAKQTDEQAPKKVGRPRKKVKKLEGEPALYRCTRCGKEWEVAKGHFFMNKFSTMFGSNSDYTHICVECANELFKEYESRFKDTKLALMLICHDLDIYFSDNLYENMKTNSNFTLGTYIRCFNGTQYKKNFNNAIIEMVNNKGLRPETEIRDDREEKWRVSDKKNKNYVISSVGYDCFEDSNYSDDERKFLFNTMADYLTDEVLEDPHKLQQVIILVKTLLQSDEIDKSINAEFKKGIPDMVTMDKLTTVKNKLIGNINTIALDLGISAKSAGKSNKGSNTLTNIMKEMQENGFEEIKTNIVNAKMSASYQEVAKANAKALLDELNYTTDEYAQMVAQQSEIISELQDKNERLEEEVRLGKIELKKIKNQHSEVNE